VGEVGPVPQARPPKGWETELAKRRGRVEDGQHEVGKDGQCPRDRMAIPDEEESCAFGRPVQGFSVVLDV
jgi:hypothetical protein